MSDGTKIEWAANGDGTPGATWNPIRARDRETGKVGWFCVHESEGCRNCYAERINVQRFGNGVAYKAQNEAKVEIYLHEKTLLAPLSWKKPRTIFVGSMTDLFGAFVPHAFIDRVFAIAALCPQHTFIVLTKRAKRMRDWFATISAEQVPDERHAPPRRFDALACELTNSPCAAGLIEELSWPLPNVWLGVSVEDQKTADARVPDLLATPAAVRFLSCEPLLGLVDLQSDWRRWLDEVETDNNGPIHHGLDWIIVGGESGPNARPMHPDWARSLRDQCADAHVPFFFKQWGEWGAPQIPKRGYRTESEYPGFNDHLHRYVALDGRTVAWVNGSIRRENFKNPVWIERVGKSRAGALLDGVSHAARPPLAHEGRRDA